MYKKLIFTIALLYCGIAIAQKNQKPVATIVAGKVLSLQDSLKVKELFFAGLSAKMSNNYQRSAENFSTVIEIDPANDAALYEMANIYHASNKEQEAETMIRKAVTVRPENEWYWLLLADIYKKTNNLPQLHLVFDELIKISPQKDDYYFDKANALYLQNKTDDALKVYTDIEKRFGLSEDLISARQRVYQKQGKSDKAAGELEKLSESNPKDVRSMIELSQVYTKAGDKTKALEVLQKAKAQDPGNAYVRLSLADVYRAQGKTDDAFIELKAAFANAEMDIDSKVRILLSFFPQFNDVKARTQADELASIVAKTHPGDPKAFSVYGDILFQGQKFNEARTAYKKALDLNNQVYQIWEQLIRIETSQGDYEAAVKDGEEALTIFPNQGNLYLYTGIAYAQQKNHEKAISYLKSAASLQTDDKEILGQIYSSLGDSYNALKRFKESDQAYEKSLQADGDNTSTLNNYAYYLSLRGDNLDKAELMSRKSNELEKDNSSFQDTYAWILFKQKKYKDARTWMEKAIANDKGNSGIQLEHYGDILFQLGDKELAFKQWEKAKAIGVKSDTLERKINEKKYIE